MTRHDSSPRPGETGFVLIGVVIFVLALTIIGISLFSLSSYEAQFLQRSIDSEQAFQTAVGAIERAKFALSVRPYNLGSVTENLPAGVSAVAVQVLQNGDSVLVGNVLWDPDSRIFLRVTAGPAGAQRVVEATFRPILTQSVYSSLITVSEGIEVVPNAPPGYDPIDRNQTVQLDGPVWESSGQDPDDWMDHLDQPALVDIHTSPEVPVPDVVPFLLPSGPLGTAQLAAKSNPAPTIVNYKLLDPSGSPGVPAYFYTNDPDSTFSLNSTGMNGCKIQVQGLAVWLLPSGAFFNQSTEITAEIPGDTTACLVIIAGDNLGGESIVFQGYLQAHIPVVLVSSGKVRLRHLNDYNVSSFTNDLAIFARSAEFMGPDPALGMLRLHRYPEGTGPLNTFFLDALIDYDALPNATSSGRRRLDLIPGTWQVSDQ